MDAKGVFDPLLYINVYVSEGYERHVESVIASETGVCVAVCDILGKIMKKKSGKFCWKENVA